MIPIQSARDVLVLIQNIHFLHLGSIQISREVKITPQQLGSKHHIHLGPRRYLEL